MKFLEPLSIYLQDDGKFPNNHLPVILYKAASVPAEKDLAKEFTTLFEANGWANTWRSGIFTYHHYHSNTHEVMGVVSGVTQLLLGGPEGRVITLQKGDVLIIPAGVAHKNLLAEDQVNCIGAYPDGMEYDMNYGKKEERPLTDKNIQSVPLPEKDPVYGAEQGIAQEWIEMQPV